MTQHTVVRCTVVSAVGKTTLTGAYGHIARHLRLISCCLDVTVLLRNRQHAIRDAMHRDKTVSSALVVTYN